MISAARLQVASYREQLKAWLPGVALAGLVAMSAQFVAEHSQAPAMLMALVFGMAISFVSHSNSDVQAGIEFSAKSILKIGIVLLGARISLDVVLTLGWQTLCLVGICLIATLCFGIILGRILGQSKQFSVLTAGAVAICGASAAIAISSVLPKSEESEKQLFITIVGVTVLSTVAMIVYPFILGHFGASDEFSGRMIGATIHDVAQVVGAGFSVSEPAGETATLVKLVRVSLLAPTVIIIALMFRKQTKECDPRQKSPPLLPPFIVGFICLATLNSGGYISEEWATVLNACSKSALLLAIAAVGIKTRLQDLKVVGYAPIALLGLETLFIAGLGTGGLLLLGRG